MNQCNDTNNDFYAIFADGELINTKELGFLHTLAFAENAAELLRAVNPNNSFSFNEPLLRVTP